MPGVDYPVRERFFSDVPKRKRSLFGRGRSLSINATSPRRLSFGRRRSSSRSQSPSPSRRQSTCDRSGVPMSSMGENFVLLTTSQSDTLLLRVYDTNPDLPNCPQEYDLKLCPHGVHLQEGPCFRNVSALLHAYSEDSHRAAELPVNPVLIVVSAVLTQNAAQPHWRDAILPPPPRWSPCVTTQRPTSPRKSLTRVFSFGNKGLTQAPSTPDEICQALGTRTTKAPYFHYHDMTCVNRLLDQGCAGQFVAYFADQHEDHAITVVFLNVNLEPATILIFMTADGRLAADSRTAHSTCLSSLVEDWQLTDGLSMSGRAESIITVANSM